MTDPIVIPDADARLIKPETGQPSDSWYPIFLKWASAFNLLFSSNEDDDSGLATKASKLGQADAFHGMLLVAQNQTYQIILDAERALTITALSTICTSGTCTATLTVNGAPIGGSANAVSTSKQVQAHEFEVAAGDSIELTISANSSALNISFSIAYEYALN